MCEGLRAHLAECGSHLVGGTRMPTHACSYGGPVPAMGDVICDPAGRKSCRESGGAGVLVIDLITGHPIAARGRHWPASTLLWARGERTLEAQKLDVRDESLEIAR